MKTNQMPLNILFSSEELQLLKFFIKEILISSCLFNGNCRILKLEVTLEMMYLVHPLHFREIHDAGEVNSSAKG
jgi:hypothetical protein